MATIPEPDQKATRSLQAVLEWMKNNVLAAFGFVGLGMTLLSNLESFLTLANFTQFIVEHWREWTRGFWQWLVSLASWRITDDIADMLSLFVFAVSIQIKINGDLKMAREYNPSLFVVHYGITMISMGLSVAIFIIWPLAEKEGISLTEALIIGCIVTLLMYLSILVYGRISKTTVTMIDVTAYSFIFCRIWFIVTAFLVINYVGVYSDQVRMWLDTATS